MASRWGWAAEIGGGVILIAAFIVEGEPIPKQSFRYRKGGGYASARVKAHQDRIGWAARQAYDELEPSLMLVVVDIAFYRKTKRRADLDNLTKCVLDAMKGIVFGDDSQVCRLRVEKLDCDGLEPRTCVRVWEA